MNSVSPSDRRQHGEVDPMAPMSKRRRRFFLLWTCLFTVWAVAMVAIASVMPDLYYYSYYSVD